MPRGKLLRQSLHHRQQTARFLAGIGSPDRHPAKQTPAFRQDRGQDQVALT